MVSTQANIYLHPIDRPRGAQDLIGTVNFDPPRDYWMQREIALDVLSTTNYLIEMLLDNVCRASIAFELRL